MKLSGRYAPGLYLAVIGFASLAIINAFSIPNELKQASQKEAYRRQADLEKTRLKYSTQVETELAKIQRQKADAYSQNEVLPVKSFSIWGYTDNPNTPPRINFRAFPNPNQRVYIFDSANRCIGYVQNNAFHWKHDPGNQDICRS